MSKVSDHCAKATGRGRPPDPGKREAILEAASRLFMERGYGVSMEAIAAEAGVSKQTIYNQFSTKEDLFGTMVASRSDMILQPIRPILEDADALRVDADPRDVLVEFARHFLTLVTSDCVSKVYSMMLSIESTAAGVALRDYYFRNGPMRTVGFFAEYLATQHEKGRLRVPDPKLAGEAFFGMLSGFISMRTALGLSHDLDEETIERKARYCVDMFLRVHGTGDAAE